MKRKTANNFDELLAQCRRTYPKYSSSDPAARDPAKRHLSTMLARELRRRGWLVEEGYAPGSWAVP